MARTVRELNELALQKVIEEHGPQSPQAKRWREYLKQSRPTLFPNGVVYASVMLQKPKDQAGSESPEEEGGKG